MKICQWVTLVLMVVFAAACATPRLRPIHSEFEDIPVPKGLVYQPANSLIIESPSAKAARLVYRGRITPDSLRLVLRMTLEANGWRHVNTSMTKDRGIVQVYEKAGNSLQVDIYEGLWFTYAAFGASQTLPITSRPAVGPANYGTATTTAGPAGQRVTERGNGPSAMLGEPQSLSEERPAPSATPSNPNGGSPWEKVWDGIKTFSTKIFSK